MPKLNINISISDELFDVVRRFSDQSVVANMLYKQRCSIDDLVDNHVDYISICKKDKNKISYLTKDRIDSISKNGESNFWSTSKRFVIRPGAFVRKIFKDIPEKEVEKFANLYRSVVNAPEFTFKIVEGQELLDWYRYEKYAAQGSSLGASCMKHPSCQKYLHIYKDNPDEIKMLLMINRDGLLIGRSLLWDSLKVMDRIYTINDDNYTFQFKNWADNNGYLYKREQKWNNTLYFESKGETIYKEQSIKLKVFNYSYYPYFDTFKFLDKESGTLYNYIPKGIKVVTLSTGDGSQQPENFLAMDEKTNLFFNHHDTIYLDYLDMRVYSSNTNFSDINDCYIHKDDCIYNDEIRDYLFIDESKNNQIKLKARLEYLEKSKSKSKPSPWGLTLSQIENIDSVEAYMDMINPYFTIRRSVENNTDILSNP